MTETRGNIIRFKPYNGLKFHPRIPGNVEDHLKNVSSLILRPDDVMLCTYPKSGTHWVYNMIQMIRSETLQYSGTPYQLEFNSSCEIDKLDSPRTINTHLTYPLIPEMAKQSKVKIVHVLRNPKDTITSLFEFWKTVEGRVYEGDFNGMLDFCLSDEYAIDLILRSGYLVALFGGNWFSYVREWENAKLSNQNLTVLSLQYEEIKQNLYGTIIRLVKFLQLDRSESFLRDVERAVQFENLKREHVKENKKDGRQSVYRKGCVGDWKKHFTVAQNERFDAFFDKQIKEQGIDLRFSFQ